MVCSMTAFARCERKYVWGSISWEIRSLNQRYLDVYIDVPKHLYSLSWDIRKKIKSSLFRGKIECFLHIEMSKVIISEFNVNKKLIDQLIISAQWIKNKTKEGQIEPLSLLSWPGVITYKQNNISDISLILLELFKETLDYLIRDREREGLFLKECIIKKLCFVREEIKKIQCFIPVVLEMKRKKLLEQLKDFCVDSVRLEQELLIIVQKIDISEEIDRLVGHVKEVYNIFAKTGPIGRQLDFILQELYREVNTISAKSVNFNITRSSIFLKVLIEQMREQVQNIE